MTVAGLRTEMGAFYESDFPGLRSLTRQIPEAQALVRQAAQRGFELAVATSPLFPRTALEQRLEWAGVCPREHDYGLITSYEVVHFAKPSPAYYAEALALLGRPPAEAAMVGDNVDADLVPARLLGIPVYHAADVPAEGFPGGSLGGVLAWVEEQVPASALPAARTPQALSATLRGDLAALITLASRLKAEDWRQPLPPNDWSPLETLCHLRDAEIAVNRPRLKTVLTQPLPLP